MRRYTLPDEPQYGNFSSNECSTLRFETPVALEILLATNGTKTYSWHAWETGMRGISASRRSWLTWACMALIWVRSLSPGLVIRAPLPVGEDAVVDAEEGTAADDGLRGRAKGRGCERSSSSTITLYSPVNYISLNESRKL